MNLLFIAIFSLLLVACGGGSNAPTEPTTSTSTLTAPQNLQATAGDGKVNLTWNAVTGASTYTVYQDSSAVQSVTTPSVEISGLSNGTAYRFSVTARNSLGESEHSNERMVTPSATPVTPPSTTTIPLNLKAELNGSQLSLSWDANSNATRYHITLSTGGSSADLSSATTSAPHYRAILAYSTSYTVKLQALASNDEILSTASLKVTAYPAPENLRATVSTGKIVLRWDTLASASAYQVSQDGVPLSPTLSTNTLSLTALSNGTLHTFTVQARYTDGATHGTTSLSDACPAEIDFTRADDGSQVLRGSRLCV